MAIEKLPAAPVNLSGGSLLSRQPSNIPEPSNLLTGAVDSIVKAYEPTLKAAAIKEAEANAAVVGVVRGPNGELQRPPEPQGGLVYNEVYNKAVDQTYAASIAYDFQMKADKIVADNYTDPQKAIALMTATMSGATKGMDPRFTAAMMPVLQNELQQRAAGVLNRKAGDDREALVRTNNEMMDAHLNSYMDAWKVGDTKKADQLRRLIVETARNAITLNVFKDNYLNAVEAKMEIAKSRGLKAGEIEDRTRRLEGLQIAKAEKELADVDASEAAMNVILPATTLMNSDQISTLRDISNGDTRAMLTITVPTPDGKGQEVTLDAATYRYMLRNPTINRTVSSAIESMYISNEAARKADEKVQARRVVFDSVASAAAANTLPAYDTKQKDMADEIAVGLFARETNNSFDLKNPSHQVMAVKVAAHLYHTDTNTVQFLKTGIRSNDAAMIDAAIDIYSNLATATRGKNEIGSVLTQDLSTEDIKFLEYAKKLKLNKAFSPEDRIRLLENARSGNTMSYDRIRTMYDKPYDALLQQNVLKELGFSANDTSFAPPQDIITRADEYVRMYAMDGDTQGAMRFGVAAAARDYTKDTRSVSGVGPRNFDLIVPTNIIDIVSENHPEFIGKVMGKDVKYQIVNPSNADAPIIRLFIMDGKIATHSLDLDPATDLPRPQAKAGLTQDQIQADNIRNFENSDAGRRVRAGVGLPEDRLPLGYDAKTGRVYSVN
jgi:hypothetical protein